MTLFRSLILVLSAVLAVFPFTAAAHGRLVELSVVDRDSGQPLAVHYRDGQAYIEGRPGQRYAVRLNNRSGGRVLAVLSVDGVNAVSGQDAAPDQAGYVLGPYQSTDVAGWRKSLSDVAGFEFSALPDSYAARTGRPENVGVIGIAVFRERTLPKPRPRPQISGRENAPQARTEAAMPAPPPAPAESALADAMRGAAPVRQSIGTAHGQREHSRVERTHFQRAGTSPAEVVTLRYDRRDNLIALGVIPSRPQRPGPLAFPGGFVPDP